VRLSGIRGRRCKRDGDRATPSGTLSLPFGMYRPTASNSQYRSPLDAAAGGAAWVDDPSDPKYHQSVELPYPSRTEKLWMTDAPYDLVVVVGYNMNPTQPGAGIAIFLHIARPDFSPRDGCVASQPERSSRTDPM
jgi:L,D-peptidoglycan transpeptidase YkuD (ErfK/YbiS/YcfS/YnhG family)